MCATLCGRKINENLHFPFSHYYTAITKTITSTTQRERILLVVELLRKNTLTLNQPIEGVPFFNVIVIAFRYRYSVTSPLLCVAVSWII